MSFFAVLFALLIEQLKPLPRDNWVHHRLVAWVGWVGRNFDAGKPHHVWVVWSVSVLLPTSTIWAWPVLSKWVRVWFVTGIHARLRIAREAAFRAAVS